MLGCVEELCPRVQAAKKAFSPFLQTDQLGLKGTPKDHQFQPPRLQAGPPTSRSLSTILNISFPSHPRCGQKPFCPRRDHSGFGCLLFVHLNGSQPFTGHCVTKKRIFGLCQKHSIPFSMLFPPLPAADLLGRCEILIASHGSLARCLSHLTEISFSAANIITGGLDFKNSLLPVC